MAPRASAGPKPMAASTCEGWTLPEEQAAPEETATPSRSSAITAVSAFTPGTANKVVLGSRSASAPKTTASGETRFNSLSKRSRSSDTCRCSSASAPHAAAAADQRIGQMQRLGADDQRPGTLGAAQLVAR